jgi:hypothetical protein
LAYRQRKIHFCLFSVAVLLFFSVVSSIHFAPVQKCNPRPSFLPNPR